MNKKKKILIIEDEKTLSDALIKKLKVEGYETDSAYDGDDGLEKIKTFKPDLILLDILMPRVDGFQVMEAVHNDAELSKIPIIIISNSGQPVEIERAIKLGVRDYLVKAEFDPSEVMDKVKNIIGGPEQTKGSSCNNKEKNKILIVEDDQLLRSLCSRKFTSDGFHVETAVDAEDGLKKIASQKPDLVLLDLVLPGMNGFEALQKIKSNPDKEISGIPVIILSNLGQEDDIKKGQELGAADYLIKASTTTNEIVEKVRKILCV